MKYIGMIGLFIVGIVLLISLLFGANMLGLQSYKFFAPKYENVRREVFLNTKSFQEGKRQELIKYRMEYLRAKDNDEKSAIATTIRMSMSQIDTRDYPVELQQFLSQINGGF